MSEIIAKHTEGDPVAFPEIPAEWFEGNEAWSGVGGTSVELPDGLVARARCIGFNLKHIKNGKAGVKSDAGDFMVNEDGTPRMRCGLHFEFLEEGYEGAKKWGDEFNWPDASDHGKGTMSKFLTILGSFGFDVDTIRQAGFAGASDLFVGTECYVVNRKNKYTNQQGVEVVTDKPSNILPSAYFEAKTNAEQNAEPEPEPEPAKAATKPAATTVKPTTTGTKPAGTTTKPAGTMSVLEKLKAKQQAQAK